MVRKVKRGASRKPVKKQRQPIAWSRLLRPAIAVLVVLAVVGLVDVVNDATTLPILHVTVEGEFIHVDKEDLVNAVTPYATGSFFSVDVARLRKAGESLPWVKQIQVRRIWPDSLHLIVEEQTAVARWKDKWLLNEKGETFLADEKDIPANLAVLEGPENSQQGVVKRYREMIITLAKTGLAIRHLQMDERRAWKLTLSNNIKIELGRADSEKRFARFIQVYNKKLQQYKAQIAVMDMRYTNGLAVTWRQGQQPNFSGIVL